MPPARLINAAMKSSDWDSTAIFLGWDDWGGFYDHVVPPRVDQNGSRTGNPPCRAAPARRQPARLADRADCLLFGHDRLAVTWNDPHRR